MEFIETPLFTKKICNFLSDEEYRFLQEDLNGNPELGDKIKGTGGLRKLRWGIAGKGKRGGARIIYYWYSSEWKIYMITVYKKSEKEDLTKDQLKQVVAYIKEYL